MGEMGFEKVTALGVKCELVEASADEIRWRGRGDGVSISVTLAPAKEWTRRMICLHVGGGSFASTCVWGESLADCEARIATEAAVDAAHASRLATAVARLAGRKEAA